VGDKSPASLRFKFVAVGEVRFDFVSFIDPAIIDPAIH
jgi:hypothetical protein